MHSNSGLCPFCCLLTQSVRLFVIPRTVAHQAPLSMGIPQQAYCSGLPCPSPGDLHHIGIELQSLTLQADSLPHEPPGKPKNTGVDSLFLLQGFSQPRNQNRVSCTAGEFFTSWATKEASHPLPPSTGKWQFCKDIPGQIGTTQVYSQPEWKWVKRKGESVALLKNTWVHC